MRTTVTLLDGDVIVVDDFYRDPDKVRELALRSEFVDFGTKGNFPGRESRNAFFTRDHAQRFSDIVGTDIDYDPARWVFGKFRAAEQRQQGRTKVHIDRVDWTAVINLSVSQPDNAALGLFRHRRLGFDRVPDADTLAELGYRDLADFDARVVFADTCDDESWELLASVSDRYNRCVVFRGGKLFHNIQSTYGDDLTSCRLTQNFFFNVAVELIP
jgi:hypothetical protein